MYSLRLIPSVFLVLTFTFVGFGQHQGHQMPTPVASPTPASTPSPSPANIQTHRHSEGMVVPNASTGEEKTKDAGVVDTSSLIVMDGDELGIRVGSSDTNLISMGAMGSGTSWQPSSGPMHMRHWTKGNWLLMFHYNLFAGVNRQGGPRGRASPPGWPGRRSAEIFCLSKRHGCPARAPSSSLASSAK